MSLVPYPPNHAVGRVLYLDSLLALVTAQQGDPRTVILAAEFPNYVTALRDTIQALALGLPPDMARELMRLRTALQILLKEGPFDQEAVPWVELGPTEWEARWVGLRLRAVHGSTGWSWSTARVVAEGNGEHHEHVEMIGRGVARELAYAKRFAISVAISSIGSNATKDRPI